MIRAMMLLVAGSCSLGAEPAWTPPKPHRFTPVVDQVYLQETGRQVKTDGPIEAVGVLDGTIYTGQGCGVRAVKDGKLVDCKGPAEAVRGMETVGDALYVITKTGLHRLRGKSWRHIGKGTFVDVCGHLGKAHVAAPDNLFAVEGDKLAPLEGAYGPPREILKLTSYAETLYCLTPGGELMLFSAGAYDAKNTVDFGVMPSEKARDVLAIGNRLFMSTDKGLAMLRGMGLMHVRGEDGLCYEDTTCLAEGFDDDLWIGTPKGVIRMVDGDFHYFMAKRWLPHNKVRDVACAEKLAVVATEAGLGIIAYEPYTLEKKAAYYERWMEEWGQKRLGFTHKLEWDAPTQTWMREVSDNDAGFTAHYLAAMCFKYAVTGDAKAREAALDSFKSLKWCEEASTIDGFPARSMWAKGETGHKAQDGSGGYPAEWNDCGDGKFEWKGDTSSDEVDAHFYASALFYELAAKGNEKALVKEHLQRIGDHIVDHGWVLIDVDGLPTVWARWDPEYFASARGHEAFGLNGMEILGFMRAAHVITGKGKFERAYRELIDMGYLTEVVRQKLVDFEPKNAPPELKQRNDLDLPAEPVCDFDDRLAWFVYTLLGLYEKDPQLRSVYMRSLERSWAIKRHEHQPWANFLYGAITGHDCEVAPSVRHLREWPLDLILYSYDCRHRDDLFVEAGYVNYVGRSRTFSPRVTGPRRWTSAGLNLRGGGGGKAVVDPSGWIEAYWMGRYFGFIKAPTTKDKKLLTAPHRGKQFGAKPYDGPPRPPVGK